MQRGAKAPLLPFASAPPSPEPVNEYTQWYLAVVDSLQGQLLIAPAHLSDPNFAHTVVLMIQHDAKGAFGVVLNRPSGRSIQDVWTQVRGTTCSCAQEVHMGGPVTGPLVALHKEPALAEMRVLPGVYCSMGAERIEELVAEERAWIRFYAGYSGWGQGQLEAELATGSWLTTPASADEVFDTPDGQLWTKVVKRATGTGIAFDHLADLDPELN